MTTGLKAAMPVAQDNRTWSQDTQQQQLQSSMNVFMFAEPITDQVRQGLLQKGVFAALYADGSPQSADSPAKLQLVIKDFNLARMGNNAWLIPHMLVDGLLLPVFTVTTVASSGEVDMGAYLIPSTKLGTNLRCEVLWTEEGLEKPVMTLAYQIKVELGSVSEMALRDSLTEEGRWGHDVGKDEGKKAVDELVMAIACDPHWAYVGDYRSLAAARQTLSESLPLSDRIAATESLLPLLRRLSFNQRGAKILTDQEFDSQRRAELYNEYKKSLLGVEELPAGESLTAQQVDELDANPAVMGKALVEADISKQALDLLVKVLTPPAPPKPMTETAELPGQAPPVPAQAEAEAKPVVPEPANAPELRAALRAKLVAAVSGKPLVQQQLLNRADTAVGHAWEPMEVLLEEVGSAQTKAYLAKRQNKAAE